MQSLLINPSADQIDSTLSAAIEAANKGARARLVSSYEVEDWAAKIASQPEGVLIVDGGGVSNSYNNGHAANASTTFAQAAWWTDGRGRKTVRIAAARCAANRSSYGRGGGVSHACGSPWAETFPERARGLSKAHHDRLVRLLDRVGPEGQDDRLAILSTWGRHLAAACDRGLLISDHATRPRVVQVVVRDATTGQRHHITVPPKFGTPTSKTYQSLGSSAARVHAAIAWTFNLAPAAYCPTVEA